VIRRLLISRRTWRAVAAGARVAMVGLGGREIQGVINGHGTWLATRSMNCNSVSVMHCGVRRPKPMAPRRCWAVVAEESRVSRTLCSRKRFRKSGKRVSPSVSLTTKGCCVCQTQPEDCPSTGDSLPAALFSGDARGENVKSHDVASGIVETRVRKSKSMTERKRSERS